MALTWWHIFVTTLAAVLAVYYPKSPLPWRHVSALLTSSRGADSKNKHRRRCAENGIPDDCCICMQILDYGIGYPRDHRSRSLSGVLGGLEDSQEQMSSMQGQNCSILANDVLCFCVSVFQARPLPELPSPSPEGKSFICKVCTFHWACCCNRPL